MSEPYLEIAQGVRSWIRTGLGLTKDQVLPSHVIYEKDFKVPLPFLTVRVITVRNNGLGEQVIEHDPDEDDVDLSTTQHTKVDKTAIVDINGYGLKSFAWLEDLEGLKSSIEAQDALDLAELGIEQIYETREQSQFLDTDIEMSFSKRIDFSTGLSSTKYRAIPLKTVELNFGFTSEPLSDPDPDFLVIEVEVENLE